MIIKTLDIIAYHNHELAEGSVALPVLSQMDGIAKLLAPHASKLSYGKRCIHGHWLEVSYKHPEKHLHLALASEHWIHLVSRIDSKEDNCALHSCHIDSSEIAYAIEFAIQIKNYLESHDSH